MMLETVAMVADWLDGTKLDVLGNPQGVATQLASMPYDTGQAAPASPLVLSEIESPSVARGDGPEGAGNTYPALAVSINDFEIDAGSVDGIEQHGYCRVLVRYLIDEPDSAQAIRDGYHIMRAVRRSLTRLHLTQEVNAGRLRNSIAIDTVNNDRMKFLPPEPMAEGRILAMGWLIAYQVREQSV